MVKYYNSSAEVYGFPKCCSAILLAGVDLKLSIGCRLCERRAERGNVVFGIMFLWHERVPVKGSYYFFKAKVSL